MIAVRVVTEQDWREWRALRLAALAEAPGAFSSTLAEWSGVRDTEERWRARLRDVPLNIVADLDRRAVGMAGAVRHGGDTAELISMWVAPGGRGHGVGDALIGAVADWASQRGCRRLVLAVRTANHPAVALYGRNGFVDTGPSPDCPDGPDAERLMERELPAVG